MARNTKFVTIGMCGWTLLTPLVLLQSVLAQHDIEVRRVPWAWYNPHDAITSRVYAQADLIRAQGDVAVDLAQARKIHADAVDKELDNWVKHVRAYWDRKLIRERKRLELEEIREVRKGRYLNRQKYRNSRTWQRLKDHPELTQVVEGKALNFLLQRLSGTALRYAFVNQDAPLGQEVFDELQLSPEQLHCLNLRQKGRGTAEMTFRADGSSNIEDEWWPYLLRWKEFDKERHEFEKVRDATLAEINSGTNVDIANLQQLEAALGKLSQRFFAAFSQDDIKAFSFSEFAQYRASELFLSRLDNEIVRLQNTGDGSAFRVHKGYANGSSGGDLVGLLTHMTRNGIEFAPAVPGDEPVYYTVFAMMRDLYVTVATDDAGIRPQPLTTTP